MDTPSRRRVPYQSRYRAAYYPLTAAQYPSPAHLKTKVEIRNRDWPNAGSIRQGVVIGRLR